MDFRNEENRSSAFYSINKSSRKKNETKTRTNCSNYKTLILFRINNKNTADQIKNKHSLKTYIKIFI